MAEDRWKEPFRIGSRQGELVGMADPGRLDLDQDLPVLWAIELDRLDLEGLSGPKCDCCARLHDRLPGSSGCSENNANLENFKYSEGMKKFDHSWDEATLDLYLADPRTTVPGTTMIFPGIKDKTERDEIIAYLATPTLKP